MVFAVAVVENIGRCWQSDRRGGTDCVWMCGYLNENLSVVISVSW